MENVISCGGQEQLKKFLKLKIVKDVQNQKQFSLKWGALEKIEAMY